MRLMSLTRQHKAEDWLNKLLYFGIKCQFSFPFLNSYLILFRHLAKVLVDEVPDFGSNLKEYPPNCDFEVLSSAIPQASTDRPRDN